VLFLIPAGRNENLAEWVNRVIFQGIFPGPFGSLLFAIVYMLICWSVGKVLDKKKIYVRV
jgi:predicted acyltransferase